MAAAAQSKASADTARINLIYTRLLSPISGRVGRSSVTEGALVTANQTATLATVQQLDPIKDTDRLRKYLAHFDLDWASLGARPL